MIWCDRTLVRLPGYLGVATTEAGFQRQLRYLHVPMKNWPEFTRADATTHFFECRKNGCAIVCYRPDKTKTLAQVAALMAHEACHVWTWALNEMGEKNPSDEFMAYGIQNITQQLLQAVWGKRGQKGDRA